MTGEPVSVLVVDPLPLYRDALARIVRQDRALALAGEVATGAAAFREIGTLAPEVAVVAVPLPDVTPDRLPDAIARDGLPTRVVMVLTQPDAGMAFTLLAAGAAACLTRAADAQAIARAVVAAARGESMLAPELQTGLAEEIRRRHPDRRPALSVREREILTHVAADRCTAEIAGALRIRESTVKTHLANASVKLGVSTRAAAVAAAMRVGLVD